MNDDKINLLERRLKREKSARKQAENLLETKSLELYEANINLQNLADSQEYKIQKRTNELKIARDKALSASRAKTNFLATMSHEIRTPMNGVIGMAQLLLETKLTSTQRTQLTVLHSSAKSLLHIINDILDMSKLESGKLEIKNQAFDLLELLDEIFNSLAIIAAQKHIELIKLIDLNVPHELIGDPMRLRQILINLLGNAIKFTQKGYVQLRLTLNVNKENTQLIRFEVIDTGIGISKEVQIKLFKPFSQITDYAHDKQYQHGTGLGLSISKKLTKAMNGKIGVKSEKDKGSNFWFELPFITNSDNKKRELLNIRVTLYQTEKTLRDLMKQLFKNICKDAKTADKLETLFDLLAINKEQDNYYIVDSEYLSKEEYSLLADQIQNNKYDTNNLIIIQSITENHPGLGSLCQDNNIKTLIKPLNKEKLFHIIANENEDQGLISPSTVKNITKEKANLLLVEDNKVNQMVAKALLENQGYKVAIANDGIEAIEMYKNDCFSLVLMDINMPRMGGIEATQELRKIMNENGINIPVIALTANALVGAEQEYLKQGMDAYVTKPIDMTELRIVLDKWI